MYSTSTGQGGASGSRSRGGLTWLRLGQVLIEPVSHDLDFLRNGHPGVAAALLHNQLGGTAGRLERSDHFFRLLQGHQRISVAVNQ